VKRPSVKGVAKAISTAFVTGFAVVGIAATSTVVVMGVHGDLRAMADDWAKVQMSKNHCPGLHNGPFDQPPHVIGNPIHGIHLGSL
jgi:hypothetical protein